MISQISQILKKFYSCTIKSILTGCITACYGNCLSSDRKALQRLVRTAQYITGAKLPDIQDLHTRRCQRKAQKWWSKTPVTQVIDYSLCYRTASGTEAPSLGPKGSLTASTPSHKTAKQLIKWLLRLFTFTLPFVFTLLLLAVYYLCMVTLPLPICTNYLN